MKNFELGKVDSPSIEDTQVGNRVKKRKMSNQNTNKRNQNPKTATPPPLFLLPPEKSPPSFNPKYMYRRFNSPEAEKRFFSLKGFLITGKPVNFEKYLDLSKWFKSNNLEALFVFERPDFYYGLVREFYCNLESKVDYGNNLELTSTVTGRNIVLNELQIYRALNMSTRMLDFPKLSSFKFSKSEFYKLLEFLSGNPIPQGHFENEILISLEFLCPSAQFLAMIIRTNLLPKFGSEKLLNFTELKLIDLFLIDLQLNIPHLILSHIVASNKANTMVYGILLTAIFKYLLVPLFEHPFTTINFIIHGRYIQQSIPLTDSLIMDANSVDKAISKIVVDESIQKMLSQLVGIFDKKNQELREMVERLDKKLEDSWLKNRS